MNLWGVYGWAFGKSLNSLKQYRKLYFCIYIFYCENIIHNFHLILKIACDHPSNAI